jgi:hypothetical protein
LQLRVMLEELLAGTANITLAGEPTMTPFPEIGPWQVPVRLQRKRASP